MRPPVLVVRLQSDVEYIILTQVNISLVVHDSEAKLCVQALHSAFFENSFSSEVDKMDVLHNDFTSHSNGTVRSH
jgi:aspartate kinase